MRRRASFKGSDAELQKKAEEHVEERYLSDYRYFGHRVRRTIPSPDELEAELRRVVELFAECQDAKTEKQLFTPKTWREFGLNAASSFLFRLAH